MPLAIPANTNITKEANNHKDQHERHGHCVGTGTIVRFDPKRDALHKYIVHLPKADLCFVEKDGHRSHTVGTLRSKKK